MKKSIIFRSLGLLAACLVAATACVDDKGNYTYLDPDAVLSVKIGGLRDTTGMNSSNLKIAPDLNDGDREYAYSWYVTPTEPGGMLPYKTELSTERDLDIILKLEPRTYFFYLEVFDPARHNVSVRKRVVLRVTASEINAGWYILKDIDGQTDFDYVNEGGKLYSDVLLDYAEGGRRLEGRSRQIAVQQGRYSHRLTLPDGRDSIVQNLHALHILSDQGFRTIDAGSLIHLKDFDDQFYSLPGVCEPRSLSLPGIADWGDTYFNNAGKVYVINGETSNIGKYGAPKPGFYNAHKNMVSTLGGVLFFDMAERSFRWSEASGVNLHYPEDFYDFGVPAPVNMDYTLVGMFVASEFYGAEKAGHAIMQGVNDGKYYLFGFDFDPWMMGFLSPMGGFDFLYSFAAIPDGCRMPLAEVRAGSPSGSFIYFGDGNKLCAYRNLPGATATEQEETMLTFPASETVGYIFCRDLQVVVLTNSAAGWKLYGYELVGYGNPELKPDPTFTYSGTGAGRHVMYRYDFAVE